jgi:hypothetical protein
VGDRRLDGPEAWAGIRFLIGSGLMFRGEIAPGLGWFASTRPPGLNVFVCATQAELLGRYSKIEKPHQTMRSPDASGKPRRSHPLVHIARRWLNAAERNQLAADYEAGRSTARLIRPTTLVRARSSTSLPSRM